MEILATVSNADEMLTISFENQKTFTFIIILASKLTISASPTVC